MDLDETKKIQRIMRAYFKTNKQTNKQKNLYTIFKSKRNGQFSLLSSLMKGKLRSNRQFNRPITPSETEAANKRLPTKKPQVEMFFSYNTTRLSKKN